MSKSNVARALVVAIAVTNAVTAHAEEPPMNPQRAAAIAARKKQEAAVAEMEQREAVEAAARQARETFRQSPEGEMQEQRRIHGVTTETCVASFPARISETRAAVTTQRAYMKEYSKAMPWFDAHCRLLSELEIAIRKLNDPASFVCDTAKGRPPALTPKFVREHANPASISDFQPSLEMNRMCAADDPVVLVDLDAPTPPTIDPSDSEETKNQIVAAFKKASSDWLARLTATACFGKPGRGLCAKREVGP